MTNVPNTLPKNHRHRWPKPEDTKYCNHCGVAEQYCLDERCYEMRVVHVTGKVLKQL